MYNKKHLAILKIISVNNVGNVRWSDSLERVKVRERDSCLDGNYNEPWGDDILHT